MSKRRPFRVLAAVAALAAAAAFAQAKTKEEAQAEVDKGKTKSCEVAKRMLDTSFNQKNCAEEIAKAKALDCSAPRSFKVEDVTSLTGACAAKARAAAGSGAAAPSASGSAKKETKCKVLDSGGAVVLEDVDASTISCQRKVKDLLVKKCDASTKKLQYQFVSEVLGRETKPTKMTVYCPKS